VRWAHGRGKSAFTNRSPQDDTPQDDGGAGDVGSVESWPVVPEFCSYTFKHSKDPDESHNRRGGRGTFIETTRRVAGCDWLGQGCTPLILC